MLNLKFKYLIFELARIPFGERIVCLKRLGGVLTLNRPTCVGVQLD